MTTNISLLYCIKTGNDCRDFSQILLLKFALKGTKDTIREIVLGSTRLISRMIRESILSSQKSRQKGIVVLAVTQVEINAIVAKRKKKTKPTRNKPLAANSLYKTKEKVHFCSENEKKWHGRLTVVDITNSTITNKVPDRTKRLPFNAFQIKPYRDCICFNLDKFTTKKKVPLNLQIYLVEIIHLSCSRPWKIYNAKVKMVWWSR